MEELLGLEGPKWTSINEVSTRGRVHLWCPSSRLPDPDRTGGRRCPVFHRQQARTGHESVSGRPQFRYMMWVAVLVLFLGIPQFLEAQGPPLPPPSAPSRIVERPCTVREPATMFRMWLSPGPTPRSTIRSQFAGMESCCRTSSGLPPLTSIRIHLRLFTCIRSMACASVPKER